MSKNKRKIKISVILTFVFLILSITFLSIGFPINWGPGIGFGIIFGLIFMPFAGYTLSKFIDEKRNNSYIKEKPIRNKKGNSSNSYAANNSNNYSSNSHTSSHAESRKVYGWDENSAVAEYSLIYKFTDYIERNFKELPLDPYVTPNNIYEQISNEIHKNGKPSVDSLTKLALSMEKHLGYNENKVIVYIKDAQPGERIAGTHERLWISFSCITINYSSVYSADNVIQIMAHEISHAYQQYCGHPSYNENESESEKFTDALAIFLGFTDVYKNGQKYETDGVVHKLGYLNDNSLFKVDDIRDDIYVRVKPIRENKKSFEKIVNALNNSINALEFNISGLNELINLVSNNIGKEEKDKIKHIKAKYITSDYLDVIKSMCADVYKLTEKQIEEKIKFVNNEILLLIEQRQFVESTLYK